MITVNLPNFITQTFVDQFMILIYLSLIDIVFGTILALVNKKFDWAKFGGFFKSDGIPVLGFVVVKMLMAIPAEMVPEGLLNGISSFAYIAAFAMIAASILKNVGETGVLSKQINAIGVRHTPNTKEQPEG